MTQDRKAQSARDDRSQTDAVAASSPARKRLSPKMREALRLMAHDGGGVVHSGSENYADGDVWVGFRTAKALARRGLARIDWTDCIPGEDYPDLTLTDDGLRAAGAIR